MPTLPSHPALSRIRVDRGHVAIEVEGAADAALGAAATSATPFHFCSAAKALTAVGVIRLAARGALSLEDPVSRFVSLPAGTHSPTVRQLLTHRGGVIDGPASFSPSSTAPPLTDVLAGRHAAEAVPIGAHRVPGTVKEYSDGGYCLIERAVEIAAGQPFADAMHEVVFAPLALTRTAYWGGDVVTLGPREGVVRTLERTAASGHDPRGIPVRGRRLHYPGLAASGLWSSSDDIAVLLADLGRAMRGEDAVLLTPAQAEAWTAPWPGTSTASGVWRISAGAAHPWIMTQGWGEGFQCQLRWYPSDDRAVAVVMNQDPGVPQTESAIGAAIRAAWAE